MKRQTSMHSFLSKPTLQLKENPNSNPKPGSYGEMSKSQEEKHLLFDQLKSKFAHPKAQSSSAVVEESLSEVQAIKTPSVKKERHPFAGSYFSKEESPRHLQQQTPVQKEPYTSKDTPRQHVSDPCGNNFEAQLNALQNDAAADHFGPITPATQRLVPRIKRVHEEDLEHNVSSDSCLNKRRKLIEALGEDGLEQGKAWEKARSKFEFLDPLVIRDANLRKPSDPLYDKRTLHVPKDVLDKMSASQKQYWKTKSLYMDTILFFKVGKFYELYELDAEIGQKEFDWKLTISGVGKCRQVGVPESGIEDAVQKLLARGYKVGRMEQIETAQEAKAKRGSTATVNRELFNVLTPATAIDEIRKPEAVHLLALKEEMVGKESNASVGYGFAFVDAAACQFFVGSLSDDSSCSALGSLLMQVSPQELLFETGGLSKETRKALKKYSSLGSSALEMTALQPGSDFMNDSTVFELIQSRGYFKGSFAAPLSATFDGIIHKELATSALGALVAHLHRMKLDDNLLRNGAVSSYEVYKGSLRLDGQTLSNLEIFNNNADGGKEGTLFKYLDNCTTPFGKRLLRRWICHPLRSVREINYRLDAVEELMARPEIASPILERLRKLPDLERFVARVKGSWGSSSVHLVPLVGKKRFKQRVTAFCTAVKGLQDGIDLLKFIHIGDQEGPPKSRLLQESLSLKNTSEADKILKQMDLMIKDHFSFDMKSQKQDDDLCLDEVETLNSIVSLFCQNAAYWSQIVDAISCIDVLLSFATTANSSNGSTCRPSFVTPEVENNILGGRKQGSILSIKGLWHPYALGGHGGVAVPNDVDLGNDGEHDCPRAMLLTGPNMGGKSTLLRATCLTVIMAQLGCFVPCESCVLSPADIIFTRLGARDHIMAGESTFLVECMEAASVLRYATHESLVVLDELGRGTSTFDGYAIAYAVFRHMVEKKDCRLLFATHYHPLTKEFSSHPCVSLKHMACSFEANTDIVSKKAVRADNSYLSSDFFGTERQLVFLYKLRSGASPESYGLQVALLAGMPKAVVKAAFDAGQVMKTRLSSNFVSSELRAELSTIHEQWLKTLLAMPDNNSLCNNLDVTREDAYDTLFCLWHEMQKFSR